MHHRVGREHRHEHRSAGGRAKATLSKTEQTHPGTVKKLNPSADHGEESYVGTGKLKGRAAIVTGADSGIGRAVAIAFAKEGADVLLSYLPEEEPDAADVVAVIEKAGRKAVKLPGDIRKLEYCQALVVAALKEFGRLDVVVNNAGFQMTHDKLEDVPLDEVKRTFDTNIFGTFALTQAALKELKPGASILNTTSIQAYQPGENLVAYAATKAAVLSMTKSVAKLAIEQGIRVNAVARTVSTPLIPSTMPPEKVEKFGENTVSSGRHSRLSWPSCLSFWPVTMRAMFWRSLRRNGWKDTVLVAGEVRIGISGWRYAGWRGVFYPPKLPQRSELAFAAKNFNSIEINGTHYSLQRPEYFAQWAEETPDDSVFAVKGSRFITHMKKLRDVEDALANFFAQGILRLGKKLGRVLWQFPPRFVFDPVKLESFFKMLPRTMKQAAQLAGAHGPKLHGRAHTTVERGTTKQEIRLAVKIFPATNPGKQVQFHQIDRKTHKRVHHQNVDEAGEVEKADLVKGFEYAKDKYIEIDPEELKALRLPTATTMPISQFVNADEISPGTF